MAEHSDSVTSPYQFSDRLGDYVVTRGFPTEAAMRRWEQKQHQGLWYDWDARESNDPRWAEIEKASRIVDAGTGIAVEAIVFYHAGTRHLERMALLDGSASSCKGQYGSGNFALIVETRELIILYGSEEGQSGVYAGGEKLAEVETWTLAGGTIDCRYKRPGKKIHS